MSIEIYARGGAEYVFAASALEIGQGHRLHEAMLRAIAESFYGGVAGNIISPSRPSPLFEAVNTLVGHAH